ncbi:DNA cross-link repair protein PSO2/SNM1 [Mycena venus]|uniref:DNA cross-link repair protein PSO2/SNM1 n=1 Tax=Mycena venus TaxID=2733690 RepID=A0A8H6YCA7_9AGAR|nr:DNA cross-link repair protein PSO2/SNM1 [Mycena venus]
MAPAKKGSKTKPKDKSAVTLHNFFTSPGAGSSKKPNTPKTASKKSTPSTSDKRKSVHNPKEIIIIDSDSDVEVEVVSTVQKKRRRSGSSSDVEVLPNTPIKRVNTAASAPPALPEPTLSFGRPSALLISKSESSVSLSFGSPSTLLGGPAPTVSTLLFGNPSSLLLGNCPSPNGTELEADDAPMDFGGDDEWGMGDDEMGVNPDDDDDDGSMQIDDPGSVEVYSCPLCQKVLDDLSETEREGHVNACLDASSGAEPGPFKAPPLKPLSSLPVPSALGHKSNRSNAFSVLMTSRSEMAIWTEATAAETSRATKKNRRPAPFYKVMQGMPIAVDAFRYGCIPGVTAYFLTHAHSDHYTNLSSSWKHGPIYCSEGTANLIIHILSVDKKWVHPLPMDVPTVVPNTGGVHVTLIEANHCPGSCLFLFEGPQTVDAGDSAFKSPFVGSSKTFRYLHCGDFRASPQHTSHPAVKGKHIDHVYLDTTYLDPKYTFPPQPLVISACAELAKRIKEGRVHDNSGPKMDSWLSSASASPSASVHGGGDPKGKQKAQPERILMVVGTYSVGKERIVKAVAQAVNSKIYCDSQKAAILRCQPDPELHALLTSDPLGADVHILPLGMISLEKLQHYLERFKGKFTRVVGFRPTGWTFRPPAGAVQSPTISSVISAAQQRNFTYANLRPARSTSTALQLIPVPYSEHSSFFELTCFALSLHQWGRMIATVNVGSERSRAKMNAWMKKWEAERRKRGKGEGVPHRRFDYW